MDKTLPASEEAKSQLENDVSWLLAEKQSEGGIIATKKYLTNENELVYLTTCSMPEANVPRIKVQIFKRVKGGVRETSYHLYVDHRFERYDNDMIFGNAPTGADGTNGTTVTQAEADMLLQLLKDLHTKARPKL
jgi:hypothetical protein